MESHIGINCDNIILGDFNVPVNKPTEPDYALLLDGLDSFNLNNRVDFSTHRGGTALDLIMHDTGLNIIMLTSHGRLFSDHNTVMFDITINGSVHRTKQVAYHKIKDIAAADFNEDLFKTVLDDPMGGTLNDKVSYYNTKLRGILDKHGPINIKRCSSRKMVPWFNEGITATIRERRRLECAWYRDKLDKDDFICFY